MSYSMSSSDRLDATFAALADPSQPAISRHLRVLERAGLISSARDAQRRPRRIEAKPLAEASDWLENYRKFWEGSFQRLDALLDELKALDKKARKKPRRSPRDIRQ